MKKIIYILLSCIFTLCSCSGSENGGGGGGGGTTPTIKITSSESVTIAENGGEVSITFTSSDSWNASVASSGSDWCSLNTKTGGSGSGTIIATIKPNDSYSERNTSVTIASGKAKAYVTITQKQNDAILVSSDKVEIDYNGGKVKIQVKSNVNYTYSITSGGDWIKEGSASKALQESYIYLDIAENWDEKNPREGEVAITNGTITEKVKIYQQGSVERIVLSQKEYNISASENEITVELKSNCDYRIEMPKQDWIQEVSTKAVSQYTHHFAIAKNETYDNRSATIKFINTDNSFTDSVVINQSQINAIIPAKNQYEVGYKESILDFEVSTNIEFTIKTDVDWINPIVQTKGLVEIPLSFKISQNTLAEERIGHISLSNDSIVQTITIIQAPSNDRTTIKFTHNGRQITAPDIYGNGVAGTIDWGDSKTDSYSSSKTHYYPESDNKEVTINVSNGTSVKFNSLTSISSIDFEITEEEK